MNRSKGAPSAVGWPVTRIALIPHAKDDITAGGKESRGFRRRRNAGAARGLPFPFPMPLRGPGITP